MAGPVLPRSGSLAAGTPQPHGRIRGRPSLPLGPAAPFWDQGEIDSGQKMMPGHAIHADDTVSVRDGLGPDVREAVGGSGARLAAQGEIGFAGLGRMGAAMAANLAADGGRVVAYVRRPEQVAKLAALGIKPTTDITDLFGCEVVISMLPDDAAVGDVVFGGDGVRGLGSGLQPGAIHVSMSTISTAAATRMAGEHARRGQGYVAAPVFGNPQAATTRQLFIVAAGHPAHIEHCQPILDSLGQRTFVAGRDPWHANLIKLLGNMMSATALEMISEAVAVFVKRGLEPQMFIDIMTSTMFGGRAHKIYGDRIVSQSYAPGFVIPLVLKDVRLALAEAEDARAPMPSVGVVRDRLITGIARGYADLDWTALGLIAAEEAGLYLVPPRTVT
jgi:3-hydroxyisobutyrate dehydrogenase-like beta-hydroxyacid dehydrogenase